MCIFLNINNISIKWFLKKWGGGLPWWLSGEESTCQSRIHVLDPWSGKIPQAAVAKPMYHNYCACTLEPGDHNYWSPRALEQQKPPQKEVRTPQLESSPHLLQLEKANMQQWRPRAARKKWSGSDFLIRAWGMPGSEQGAGQEGLGCGQWRLRACHPAQVGTGGSPGIIRVRKAR